jgi:hypothetical protein
MQKYYIGNQTVDFIKTANQALQKTSSKKKINKNLMIITAIKAISKLFANTETYTKTVNVCGYNVTLPIAISVEAENDVLNIIKEAHEKWYSENKQNIPFDAMSWSYYYSLDRTIDSAKKFRRIAIYHEEYTQCYGFLIAYDVVGFYDNLKKEGDLGSYGGKTLIQSYAAHWQELRNISIKKLK